MHSCHRAPDTDLGQPRDRSPGIQHPAVLVLLACAAGFPAAATTNLFVTDTPLVSPPMVAPQIDARAWYNRAVFGVTNTSSFLPIPYESLNTLFFTNAPAPAGTMLGDPGFRFLDNVAGRRFWMDTWANAGTILTDHDASFFSFGISFLISDSRASILQVAATNILSTGTTLQSGAHGLIRLEAQRMDLTRSALRTGNTALAAGRFGGGFASVGASNYVNDVGISDLYWATGTNNAANGQRGPMVIDGSSTPPDFSLPLPFSPSHDIIELFANRPFTNTTVIPFGGVFGGAYAVAVHTNATSSTSSVVQVVFYPTNSLDPSASTEVRFYPGGSFGAVGSEVVVAFRSSEYDIATQTTSSNAIYLTDALSTTTNSFLSRNTATSTRRPNTYEVSRLEPFSFSFGRPANSTFSSNLIYRSTFQNRFVTNRYAAYSAQIDLASSSPSGSVPYDPTNLPGRIEILGGRVNLDQARIRAESAIVLKTSDLVSNHLAQMDAPVMSLDIRSTQPRLLLSNIAPASVQRFAGVVRAWSGVWDNQEVATDQFGNTTTNALTFHVLIVDSDLNSTFPVQITDFAARATNVVVTDPLNITKSFIVEGSAFTLSGGLTLPLGYNLGATNLINVRNFTNDGIINIDGVEWFGSDRTLVYSNYVNHGTNEASAHFIRTRNFENTGLLQADGGVLTIDALTASLTGLPRIASNSFVTNLSFTLNLGLQTNVFTVTNLISAPPLLSGVADVQLNVRDLIVSNSVINAGRLILSVTNSLLDAGTRAINRWNVQGGFNAVRRPVTSSMFGTYLSSTSPRLAQVDHFWAGANLGAVPAGFTNNLALGKLILDGGSNSLLRFFGQGANNALYVDYLELDNFATNYNAVLSIAQNFTIYFANANLPAAKLDGAVAGRLRWVPDFTGPLSSTNITYLFTNGVTVTSNVYTFNTALVSSKDLDSDGDGIVNAYDTTPIYVPESAALSVALAAGVQRGIELRWSALGYSSNFVEFKSAAAGEWQTLTNFLHGPYTAPVRVIDPITTNGPVRVYRLRVDRGPYFY